MWKLFDYFSSIRTELLMPLLKYFEAFSRGKDPLILHGPPLKDKESQYISKIRIARQIVFLLVLVCKASSFGIDLLLR